MKKQIVRITDDMEEINEKRRMKKRNLLNLCQHSEVFFKLLGIKVLFDFCFFEYYAK